jgi:signal transduction histidine kinase
VALQADVAADARVPRRAQHEVLAVLGEALANVERHADAANVNVRLARAAGDVVLTVRDDGRGFRTAPPADHARRGRYGLVGVYERAERAGGTALVRSEPGEGTTLLVRVAAEPAGPAGADRRAEVS